MNYFTEIENMVASPLETELAIRYGKYLGFNEPLGADVFLRDGVIHLTDPQEKAMLDPQDPFRHEIPDCGYDPRTERPEDGFDVKVDADYDAEDCACDEPEQCSGQEELPEDIVTALLDALILGEGNIKFVHIDDLRDLYEGPPTIENQERIVEDMRVSDVSGYERSRRYIYPDGEVVINDPWRVFIAPSGSHRVQTLNGNVNYIPDGWKVLQWTPADIDDPVKF